MSSFFAYTRPKSAPRASSRRTQPTGSIVASVATPDGSLGYTLNRSHTPTNSSSISKKASGMTGKYFSNRPHSATAYGSQPAVARSNKNPIEVNNSLTSSQRLFLVATSTNNDSIGGEQISIHDRNNDRNFSHHSSLHRRSSLRNNDYALQNSRKLRVSNSEARNVTERVNAEKMDFVQVEGPGRRVSSSQSDRDTPSNNEKEESQLSKSLKLSISLPEEQSKVSNESVIEEIAQHISDSIHPQTKNEEKSGKELKEKEITNSTPTSISEESGRGYVRTNGSMLLVISKLEISSMIHNMKLHSLTQVHFHKVPFAHFLDEQQELTAIAKQLCDSLTLTHNSIDSLEQIELICSIFSQVKRIFISDNPIFTNLKRILKPFCICHLPNLIEFNGRSIQKQDRLNAEKIFKKRQVVMRQHPIPPPYQPKTLVTAHSYISSILTQSCTIDKKVRIIENQWDQYLDDLISSTLRSYETPESMQKHLNDFVEQLMDKV